MNSPMTPTKHGDLFGPFSQYQLIWHESHRGPLVPSCWMVLDAAIIDEVTGMPAVIRQAYTIKEAIAGLPLDTADDLSQEVFA